MPLIRWEVEGEDGKPEVFFMPTDEEIMMDVREELEPIEGGRAEDLTLARWKACRGTSGCADKLPMDELVSFDYCLGGVMSEKHQIYFAPGGAEGILKYARVRAMPPIDIRNFDGKSNSDPDIFYKEMQLSTELWDAFKGEISALGMEGWDQDYWEYGISFGTQWRIVLEFMDRTKICFIGSNDWPSNFQELEDILEKYTGEILYYHKS